MPLCKGGGGGGGGGGVSRKVVLAAKVFRVATVINPVISVALAIFVDIASLIYSSYKIHKKSDSSTAKELEISLKRAESK